MVPEAAAGLWEGLPGSVVGDCDGAGHCERRVAVADLAMGSETEGSELLQSHFSQETHHCLKVLIEQGQPGEGEDVVPEHRSLLWCPSPL